VRTTREKIYVTHRQQATGQMEADFRFHRASIQDANHKSTHKGMVMLTVNDDEVLTRYLLGELPEAEHAQIEERLFQDEDCYDRLRALQADLADAYVRGELSAKEGREFARRFLDTPAGQEAALFARALNTLADEQTPAVAEPAPAPTGRWDWLWRWASGLSSGWQWALAAAMLLLCSGFVWQWLETRLLQEQLARAQQAQQEATRQQQALQDQLTRAQQRAAELAGQLTTNPTPQQLPQASSTPAASSVFALLLTPGIVRGGAEAERAVLAPGVQRLRLQLLLDTDEQFQRYVAEVRTKGGAPVWVQRDLVPRQTRLGKSLFLNLPVDRLAAGEYEVQLQGITAEVKLELSNYYAFTVTRR
jgi:hypothetical protein